MEKTIKENESDVIYAPGKNFDISAESYRLYRYQKGENVVIHFPKTLYVDSNGDHKVLDSEGQTHIVKKGWMHLKFKLQSGSKKPELIMDKEVK